MISQAEKLDEELGKWTFQKEGTVLYTCIHVFMHACNIHIFLFYQEKGDDWIREKAIDYSQSNLEAVCMHHFPNGQHNEGQKFICVCSRVAPLGRNPKIMKPKAYIGWLTYLPLLLSRERERDRDREQERETFILEYKQSFSCSGKEGSLLWNVSK